MIHSRSLMLIRALPFFPIESKQYVFIMKIVMINVSMAIVTRLLFAENKMNKNRRGNVYWSIGEMHVQTRLPRTLLTHCPVLNFNSLF